MNFSGFANPIGLWGLMSLPIIVVLHLLRERSKAYVVSSLSLWSFMDEEVSGSKANRVPISWILILQLLIASFLSLAWAQPQINIKTTVKEARHLILLVDVSTSMRARDVLPNRLSQAQIEAATLLTGLGPQDIATVLSFASTPEWLGDTRQMDLQTILNMLAKQRTGGIGHALENALAVALATTSRQIPIEVHIFSDAAFPQPKLLAEGITIQWHLFGKDTSNQAVLGLSVKTVSPNEFQLFAKFGNFGALESNRMVSILSDGIPVDSATLRLAPNSMASQVWTITGNPSSLSAVLIGSDELTEDDIAILGLPQKQSIRIGLIANDPSLLERAIGTLPGIDLMVLSPDEYIHGMPFDLIFFQGTLPDEWPAGVIFVLDPPKDHDLLTIQSSTEIQGLPIPKDDPLLFNIDFSGVRWSKAWNLESTPEGLEPLLESDNLPLLIKSQQDFSTIYVLLADLFSGNFIKHPAFPSLIANFIKISSRTNLPGQIPIGGSLFLPSGNIYPRISISPPEGNVEVLESDRPLQWSNAKDPGFYDFTLTDVDGGVHLHTVGVNAGNMTESDIRPRDWVSNHIQNNRTQTVETNQDLNLMPWLLGLTILLLLLEARLAWH